MLPRFWSTRNTSDYPGPRDAAEVYTLTARSEDNLNMDTSSADGIKEPDQATSAASVKSSPLRRYSNRFSGWRFGVLNFAICACIVLIINMVVSIWGSVGYKHQVLAEGDCGHIKSLNSALHVLINILSTILLSGSNYCMQCLSAPTRAELDSAHTARKWLDIGVPSFRNLRRISRQRLILWFLLGVTSVPLHLLYNSAIYPSIPTNSYRVFIVNSAFLEDTSCTNCTNTSPTYLPAGEMLNDLWLKSRNGSLDKLAPEDCIDAYGTLIQSTRRNLLVVISKRITTIRTGNVFPGMNNSNTLGYWRSTAQAGLRTYPKNYGSPIDWMCSDLSYKPDTLCIGRLEELKSSATGWTMPGLCYGGPEGYCDQNRLPVDYCLSERTDVKCQLHFSTLIASLVTALNFCKLEPQIRSLNGDRKAVLMLVVLFATRENPLMTMGDAVASFLDKKDVTTGGLGLLSRRDLRKGYTVSSTTWHNRRWRWKDVTSKTRRLITILLFTIALGTVTGLLIWGLREVSQVKATSTRSTLRLGFGAVDPRTLISSGQFPTDMISLAIIANAPQIILSILYFAYNSLFTAMLMGREWASYAHKRKGLRVSRVPAGEQRSTYFLSLPYRFGVPLVILSGTLHWLVSQSIFVVALDVYDESGKAITSSLGWATDTVTRTVGYSPVAMCAVIAVGIVMVIAVVGCGYVPYKSGMPLVGSCSLAISAACHPEEAERMDGGQLSVKKLKWGVVATGVDGVGHCAFSGQEVGVVVEGRMYA